MCFNCIGCETLETDIGGTYLIHVGEIEDEGGWVGRFRSHN